PAPQGRAWRRCVGDAVRSSALVCFTGNMVIGSPFRTRPSFLRSRYGLAPVVGVGAGYSSPVQQPRTALAIS
ncbi:MAG: hypothetical protein QOH17_3430, partial [Pseudonocardiales bacterium]|nr:hypothetical protein [Pseudonocardiales bacterium]